MNTDTKKAGDPQEAGFPTRTQIETLQAKLTQAVCSEHEADIVMISGFIGRNMFEELWSVLQSKKNLSPNVIMHLTTFGGLAEYAYRTMRLLDSAYSEGTITGFVHNVCKSAGTLMLTGCDILALSDGADLGPLDVQLAKRDEVFEYESGLALTQAITAIRTEALTILATCLLELKGGSEGAISAKMCLEHAVTLAVGLGGKLYEQVDPLRWGETERSMKVGQEYALRLAASRKNISSMDIQRLVTDYPDHGFSIDRAEAQGLFRRVRESLKIERALASLYLRETTQVLFDGAETEYRVEFLQPEPVDGSNEDKTRKEANSNEERSSNGGGILVARGNQDGPNGP